MSSGGHQVFFGLGYVYNNLKEDVVTFLLCVQFGGKVK